MKVYIKVENFGPIEKAEIDLRPLTICVGKSNTGKTYLAALIYALHQHFGGFAQFPRASAVSHLSLVSFLQPRYSREQQEEGMKSEISAAMEKLNTPGRDFRFSDLPQAVATRVKSQLMDPEGFPDELNRCFDLESVSNLIRFTDSRSSAMQVSMSVRDAEQTSWCFEMTDVGSGPELSGDINPGLILHDASRHEAEFQDISDFGYLFRRFRSKRWRTGDSYYLPAARSGIMQSHGVIASALIKRATRIGLDRFPEIPTFSGMIGDFLERIVRYEERNDPSSEISRIAEKLEKELLEGKIEVRQPTKEAYPEFLYRPPPAEEALRMSRVSSMVSELAPLVLFLRGHVRPGDLLIIEEPESHLHPEAQTQIAHTLARLVRAGVQIVITTHSDWLLQQIGNLIREGELRKLGESTTETADWLQKEEVGAWWFRKGKPVTECLFDPVAGIEPEDHLDIAEDLYNRSAGLQNRLAETT